MNSSAGVLAEGQEGEVPALEARNLQKSYTAGDGSELRILRGVELRVEKGEVVAVIGASGVGKSTLLHLLGALDRATGGDVLLGGLPLASMDALRRAEVRNEYVGFVFQFHHLLREFSALENVALPRRIAGRSQEDAMNRAHQLLDAVGLSERKNHLSTQLSGGEQQRVAVARALSNDPLVVLADEPSGNLDGPTSRDLHDLLFQLRKEEGTSMVLVTHNLELAQRCDRVLLLKEGTLQPWDGVGVISHSGGSIGHEGRA
jgi:lipoprotein-releasing system ATP-binding protein